MYRIKNIDLIAQKFGRLTVLRAAGKTYRNDRLWVCRCDCGNEAEVVTWRLRNGNTQSCGCLQIESAVQQKLKPSGEAAKTALFHSYRHEAKNKGVPFELTKEQFGQLTKGLCFYCGCEPSQIKHRRVHNGPYIYNGIDRLDSSKGYTIENCVSCCKIHNFMKLDMSLDDFIAACRVVVNYYDAKKILLVQQERFLIDTQSVL